MPRCRKNLIYIFAIILLYIFYCPGISYAAQKPDITVFFSPRDNCALEILKRIDSAKSSIDIAMYYFTSRPLAQALIDVKKRNVKVRVFLDGNQRTEKFSKANYLTNNGISVKINSNAAGLMHNKFCVIDNKIVITGSYNWTAAADLQNDENLIIIESTDTAEKYAQQFEKLWNNRAPDKMRYKDKDRLEKIEDY